MGDDGCQLQAVHKGGGGCTAALDPKAHHAASAVGHILLCQIVLAIALQHGALHPGHRRVLL